MSLRRRLQKLERMGPGPDLLADDPEYQCWRTFYESVLDILTPFPEARRQVEENMSIQEPCIFRADWEPAPSGADLRFYFCKQSMWAALQDFPKARQALDDFLVATFPNQALATADRESATSAAELRFNRRKEALWAAMQDSPLARQALHNCLVASFADQGLGTPQSSEEKQSSSETGM